MAFLSALLNSSVLSARLSSVEFFFTETQKQYWWYSETDKFHFVAQQRKV